MQVLENKVYQNYNGFDLLKSVTFLCEILHHLLKYVKLMILNLAVMPYPTPWTGSPDFDFTSKPFFENDPKKLMEAGAIPKDIPIMIGVTANEGLLQSATLFHNKERFEHFKYVLKFCRQSN